MRGEKLGRRHDMGQVAGYIGLGDMGAPIARRILDAGYETVVLNRTRAKMQPHIDAGARPADNPADLGAKCDVLFLCLDRLEAVEEVIFGAQGLTRGRPRVKHIVDNSTLHPETAKSIAARVQKFGISYLDCPVTGGAAGARAGKLVIMIGGSDADVEVVRPMLTTFAHRITHMGDVGAGMAGKIFNQALLFSGTVAIAETMLLADRMGVRRDRVCEALEGGAGDSVALRYYANATSSDSVQPVANLIDTIAAVYDGRIDPTRRGRMDVGLKDVEIILDLHRRAGTPTRMISAFSDMLRLLNYQAARE
jgi:3-hydroxyisobutyrate dehydrogenase-like beta-hydroxyacid dehydrogenase